MALLVDMEKRLGQFHLRVKFEAGDETMALLGASGCGKSMTLKCIAGVERPDRGRVVLDGITLFDSEQRIDLPPQKRRVGFLFQNYALFPNMTVEKNIACSLRGRRDPAAVREVVRAMRLEGLEKKRPHQLSWGQQQRTALARILVNGPELILLDEPFSALDSHLRFQLEGEIRRVVRQFGKTVLLVSHDREEAFRLARQIAIMKEGQIEQFGPREIIFERPRTVNAARLTGCKNISRAESVGDGRIYAPDWGITLTLPKETSEMDFVGIHAHDIRLGVGENAVECRVTEIVENPFSRTVMLQPIGTEAPAALGMKVDNRLWQGEEGERVTVSLPGQALLLLKE